jgi:hypothetical protein
MIRSFRVVAAIGVVTLASSASRLQADPDKDDAKSRAFLFHYHATVTGLKSGQVARIWLPIPPSNDEQAVTVVKRDLPAGGQIGKESRYGNQILYVEAKADTDGKIPFAVTYRVKRNEVRANLKAKSQENADPDLFLKPDANVPIGGKCLVLIKDKVIPSDQIAAARVIYDAVSAHMRYSKEGTGWGRGDAVWACENGYGNCSDFHSLFISLTRYHKIPTTFEIGFPLPAKRGTGDITGYHCWAKFKPDGRGWVPVDISEASKNPELKEYYFGNLTENRIAFSAGRDLTLVPKQDGPALNFFVYPYVEMDGKPYPDAKVQRQFSYEDIADKK